MCNAAVMKDPCALEFVPDHFKTQEMCDDVVMEGPCALEFFPDHFKAQEMRDYTVRKDQCALKFVPDWFATHQQVNDDDYYDDDDEIIESYEDYQERMAQKAQIKKELMPIAWHPSRS